LFKSKTDNNPERIMMTGNTQGDLKANNVTRVVTDAIPTFKGVVPFNLTARMAENARKPTAMGCTNLNKS
jgi:hypothetical protein